MGGNEKHIMNIDESMNSSVEYERTTKFGNSPDDEVNSVSKPHPRICLPAEVLQSLKNLAPED
ncbi:hypothetical protein A2U01_0090745, partial [Trifolium medium]|nr:hypothetical protein [Trifolium medium]